MRTFEANVSVRAVVSGRWAGLAAREEVVAKGFDPDGENGLGKLVFEEKGFIWA
jgi:hypothetical protein